MEFNQDTCKTLPLGWTEMLINKSGRKINRQKFSREMSRCYWGWRLRKLGVLKLFVEVHDRRGGGYIMKQERNWWDIMK